MSFSVVVALQNASLQAGRWMTRVLSLQGIDKLGCLFQKLFFAIPIMISTVRPELQLTSPFPTT